MGKWPSVVIAGGSIGGLTTGVLLAELGCDVNIFERSSEALQSRGAGIVVLPITEKYFTDRGGERNRVSLRLDHWKYVSSRGDVIADRIDPYRLASWSTVYRALIDVFDSSRYHLNSRVVDVRLGPDLPAVVLDGGDVVHADLVVCADGMASTARKVLLPGVEPSYAGYVAWRGTTPEVLLSDPALDDVRDAVIYQVLENSHMLVYAIPADDGSIEPGRRLVNFVWYRNYPAPEAFEDVMTDSAGELRTSTVTPGMVRDHHITEFLEASAALAPTLREIVKKSSDVFVQAIFDLMSPRMAFDRTCLLGDAAFAVRPHVAAGQAKACADAWALRDALEESGGDVPRALEVWEPRQLKLGHSVVTRSRRMGNRSQFEGTMIPGDPDWRYGLHERSS